MLFYSPIQQKKGGLRCSKRQDPSIICSSVVPNSALRWGMNTQDKYMSSMHREASTRPHRLAVCVCTSAREKGGIVFCTGNSVHAGESGSLVIHCLGRTRPKRPPRVSKSQSAQAIRPYICVTSTKISMPCISDSHPHGALHPLLDFRLSFSQRTALIRW